MKNHLLFIVCFLFCQKSIGQTNKDQEAIVEQYLTNCASNFNYNIQMSEYQQCLDEGLKKDSTIAYLWQQKAMPYFKARKYEIGMTFIDKAVRYDAARWQPYRAFIKCIFAKTYKEAIIDFEDCKQKFGNNYVMDHTYDFYIGLCYLQLNDYAKAETLFANYVEALYNERQALEHPTALFYYAISKYEQQEWDEATAIFDKALKIYPNFSDAKYYKAICLVRLNRTDDATVLIQEAKSDAKAGYTINEDNTIYELYPYQIRW